MFSRVDLKHRRNSDRAGKSSLMLMQEAQQDVSPHRVGERDHRHRRRERALNRLHRLQQKRGEVGIIFFEIADMARTIAVAEPLGRTLAAPVQTDDVESAGAKLACYL